jgi:phosphatidylglycerophosphatase A
LKNKIAVLVATWFYSGLIPPIILKGMAGTYGSLFSIPLVWAALWMSGHTSNLMYLLVYLAVLGLGIWSVPIAEVKLGEQTDWKGKTKTRDQNQIVIDETFGMLVTCSFLSFDHLSIWQLLIGFGFFRLFDIIKVWPTKFFDKMKTAEGVMLDDFVAGVYACICLQITIYIFNL